MTDLSIVLYLSISIAPLTARAFQKHSRPQQLKLCRSLHDEALQATASEGLAQGPYVAARAGLELATLQSKGIDSSNAPPRPKINLGKVIFEITAFHSDWRQHYF